MGFDLGQTSIDLTEFVSIIIIIPLMAHLVKGITGGGILIENEFFFLL